MEKTGRAGGKHATGCCSEVGPQAASSCTWVQQRSFQSRRPTLNQLAMFGKMPNFPEKARMVKVPIPPADQWVSAVQKSKSEKKASEGTPVGALSPKTDQNSEEAYAVGRK